MYIADFTYNAVLKLTHHSHSLEHSQFRTFSHSVAQSLSQLPMKQHSVCLKQHTNQCLATSHKATISSDLLTSFPRSASYLLLPVHPHTPVPRLHWYSKPYRSTSFSTTAGRIEKAIRSQESFSLDWNFIRTDEDVRFWRWRVSWLVTPCSMPYVPMFRRILLPPSSEYLFMYHDDGDNGILGNVSILLSDRTASQVRGEGDCQDKGL